MKLEFWSTNISINGYKFVHTPAVTSVGGAALYLSDSLTCKPREDLSNLICTNDGNLESVFVEVVLKSRKNIVIGCVYKLPLMDIDLFNNQYIYLFNNQYISPVLKSIENEGKSLT